LAFLFSSNISVLGEETDQTKPDESVLDVIAERESQYPDAFLRRNFQELASTLADTYVNTSRHLGRTQWLMVVRCCQCEPDKVNCG
jgi:hypothetical protein